MMYEQLISTENYKGYTLAHYKVRLHDRGSFRRLVKVYKDGKHIATGKTKKELKDLIDHDCFRITLD